MMKRLTIILFAFAAYGVPASAQSLSTFAYDGAGRSVLEFNPASVFAFSAKGHALMRVAVKETPSENESRGPTDLTVIIDCRLRRMTASPATPVADGASPATVSGFKASDLKQPSNGTYERFVGAVCDGELSGVKAAPAKSGWTHFIEGPQRALYFANGSVRTIGKYRVVLVRLRELGGAQLPDGRHIDARDAVWVIDCEQKSGAVAYERAFATVGDKNETVQSTGDERLFAEPSNVEVDKLRFGRAVAGSLQARFSGELCMSGGSQDLSSGHAQTKTMNFVYYTLEVPVDWTQAGTGKMQPGDQTLLVTALNLIGIEATAAPEQDRAAMKSLMAELEKNATRALTSQGCKVVEEFSAKDIGGERALIRGVFQENTGITVVQYYVAGPTYVVPLLVTGTRDGAATLAEMDPILSSLRWLGKSLERRPSAN
jgi:hypothetical protein